MRDLFVGSYVSVSGRNFLYEAQHGQTHSLASTMKKTTNITLFAILSKKMNISFAFSRFISSSNTVTMEIWVICGVSNHHRPQRTARHRVFVDLLLLWIQAQLLLQTPRSLKVFQVDVGLMSVFYLVHTLRRHNSRQIQPISRHPIAWKLQ